ncbi:hypothetical protein ABH922_005478 [Rhodococcus sp. 27YEA15]|uniref:Dabb family protein n=1 Tax=Rhodococcus sp. 27YEA15 TaxID=3156259 RepID=UPI003C7DCB86
MVAQENSSSTQQAVSYAVYSWEWKDDAPLGEIERAFDEMCAMGDDTPGVRRASWGRNEAGSANGHSHAMIVVADNKAAVDAYNLRTSKHPMSDLVHASEKSGIGIYYALPA